MKRIFVEKSYRRLFKRNFKAFENGIRVNLVGSTRCHGDVKDKIFSLFDRIRTQASSLNHEINTPLFEFNELSFRGPGRVARGFRGVFSRQNHCRSAEKGGHYEKIEKT